MDSLRKVFIGSLYFSITAFLFMSDNLSASGVDIIFDVPFDGGVVAKLSGGIGRPLKLSKPVRYVKGISGQAVLLEAQNIEYPQKGNINKKRGTAMFWICPVGWDPQKKTDHFFWFFSANLSGPNVDRIQFFRLPNPVLYYMYGSNDNMHTLLTSTNDWKDGEWRHFTLTWNGQHMKFYVNAELVGKETVNPQKYPVNTGDKITIGTHLPSAFDQLRIFNRDLSDSEIRGWYTLDSVQSEDNKAVTSETNSKGIVVTVPNIASTPDKKTDTNKWEDSAGFGGFLRIPQLEYALKQTDVKVCHDSKNIYLRLESKINNVLKTDAKTPDSAVYSDDSYEIFLAPSDSSGKRVVYQLILNSNDIHYDSKDGNKNWNGKWSSRSTVSDGKWIAEVTIPFEDIGFVPGQGKGLSFNVARNWLNPQIYTNPTFNLAYGNPENFGRLVFDSGKLRTLLTIAGFTGNGDKIKLSLDGIPSDGTYDFSLKIKQAAKEITDKTRLSSFDKIDGNIIENLHKTEKLQKGQNYQLETLCNLKNKGLYFLEAKITRAGQTLFYQLIPFRVEDVLTTDLNILSLDGKLLAEWELTSDIGHVRKLRGVICDAQGRAIRSASQDDVNTSKGVLSFDIKGLDEPEYSVEILAEGSLATVKSLSTFNSFSAAEWHGFEKKLINNHFVPQPWTPIQVDKNLLKTKTQTYDFNGGPFPEKIFAGGKELLAGPISLAVYSNGKAEKFIASTPNWLERYPDKVAFEQTLNGKSVKMQVKTSCEFDGMLRFDVSISPESAQAASMSNLTLTIPLKAENAKFKLPYPTSRQTYGILDMNCDVTDSWSDFFVPHIWIGDDNRGIAWFMETDTPFRLKDESKAIELLRKGDEVLLKINLINKPVELNTPYKFTFGLMATPSRPLRKDWFNVRLASCVSTSARPILSMGYTTGIEYHQKMGIPYPAKDAQRYIKSKSSSPGIKNLVYATSNGVGSKTPEFLYYHQEWNNPMNRDTWTYLTRGEYHNGVCPTSQSWRDFFLWSCSKGLDEYGMDGIYYDFGTVMGCGNQSHHCGYKTKDGRQGIKWPIFADRELRKNIYILFSQNNKSPMFVLHNYSRIVTPIISFCDLVLDGEMYQQLTGVIGTKQSSDFTKLIPMSRMRTMFGTQFGTTPVFLVKFTKEDISRTKPTRTIVAMTAPCGIQVWGFYCNIKVLNVFYHAQDSFGVSGSIFTPYWEKNEVFSVVPNNLLLASWIKDGRALVVISNFSDKPVAAKVKIDIPRLKKNASVNITATDAETNKTLVVDGNSVNLTVDAKDFRLLCIE